MGAREAIVCGPPQPWCPKRKTRTVGCVCSYVDHKPSSLGFSSGDIVWCFFRHCPCSPCTPPDCPVLSMMSAAFWGATDSVLSNGCGHACVRCAPCCTWDGGFNVRRSEALLPSWFSTAINPFPRKRPSDLAANLLSCSPCWMRTLKGQPLENRQSQAPHLFLPNVLPSVGT